MIAEKRPQGLASVHRTVVVDACHFDRFVEWEDDRLARPWMFGIQDADSGAVLAHRIGRKLTATLMGELVSDLIRDHGVPVMAMLDNGVGMAGQADTLAPMGIHVRHVPPYRPSPATVERVWRALCEDIAVHAVKPRKDIPGSSRTIRSWLSIAEFRAIEEDSQ